MNMTDAPGTIIAIDGDYAIVRMDEIGCGRCHEQGGCGGNGLGKMFCSVPRSFRVLNPGKSAIGEQVKIAIAEGAVRRSALMVYGLPLMALFVGTLIGSGVFGEIGAIFGAIGGLFCAWLGLRYGQHRVKPGPQSEPFITY